MKFLAASALSIVLAVTCLAPAITYAQANQPPATPQERPTGSDEFIPLTNLPGIADAGDVDSLPNFLNQLYKLCIGAAAVIAVLQIIRAGTKLFFNTGSVGQNKEAKDLIRNTIFGLLLVLSPAIIFGIINPDILELKLDMGSLGNLRNSGQQVTPAGNDIGTSGFSGLFGRVGSIVVDAAQLRTGINVTVTAVGARDGTIVPEDLVEGDRERAAAFIRSCQEANGAVKVNTGVRNGCPNNAATCSGTMRCQFSQQTQTPTTNTQPTTQVQNQQYAIRIRALNANGGFAKLYSRTFANKQLCDSYFTGTVVAEMQQRNWAIDSNFQGCDCSQPQSAFPACRQ